MVGCGNNKKNSPDRIFYSFSIKKHKLERREKWIKQCVVRSRLLRIRVRVKISNSKISEWLIFRIRKLANVQMKNGRTYECHHNRK